MFFIGATLAFHVVLTLEFLRKGQSDIVKSGFIFSLVLIFIINIVVTAFILSLVFEDISMARFFESGYDTARSIYLAVFGQLFSR